MISKKKFIILVAAVLAIAFTTVTALAVTKTLTPSEILAGLTGKSVEVIIEERAQAHQTYGALANKYDVLDAFQAKMLEQKKDYLKQRVAEGTMTQERADAILAAMEANQANCDGTGSGAGYGLGCGMGNGAGQGRGMGGGFGRNASGRGAGYGCGGSCQYATAN